MQDISGNGISVRLIASQTFPTGITLTHFADDTDPLDFPSVQVADKGMGVNGDMVAWSVASPVDLTLAVIPNTVDDLNLMTLLEANRVSRDKASARDIISITSIYPDGSQTSVSLGKITNGSPAQSIASAGRMKSKQYVFAFEKISRTNATGG